MDATDFIVFPFGEDWDYDLIVSRDGRLERLQVKYAESRDGVLPVRCRSMSLTNGRVRAVKHYTAAMIDWLAVYDAITHRCFYVPSTVLAGGGSELHLRLTPVRNAQRVGIRFARTT